MNTQELLAAAQAEPARDVPPQPDEVMPVVIILREEKHLSWKEISEWVKEKTKLARSDQFWAAVYGKLKGVKKTVRKRAPKVASPTATSSPASTSPAQKTSAPNTTGDGGVAAAE